MARKKQNLLKGRFTHRRTEGDYMGVLLDAVTLADWRAVITSTVAAAKNGDPSARTFLAQYLVGRPDAKAPAPLTVVVQQLSGCDPLVDKLANPHIASIEYPGMHGGDNWKEAMKARVAEELRTLMEQKSDTLETVANAGSTRAAADFLPSPIDELAK